MTTANDLCHTVAKHSFPYSFNSDKHQEFNDEGITETDIFKIDVSVELENAINLEVLEEDLERTKINVAVVEAARFCVTEGDLTRIDQSAEEHRAKMAMNVDVVNEKLVVKKMFAMFRDDAVSFVVSGKKVAHITAAEVPIAVPMSCRK